MPAATARKYIEIELEATKALAELKKMSGHLATTEKKVSAVQTQFAKFGNVVKGSIFAIIARQVLGLTGALTGLADTALDITARLNAVSGSAENGAVAFEKLLAVANKNGAGVEELSTAFAKLKTSMPYVESQTLVDSLDTVSRILGTTGASAQATNAVMLQLTQGLASAAVQGDEFKSISENAPVLLQAWREAAGLTNLSLKEISAQALFTRDSFIKLQPEIDKISRRMIGLEKPPLTVARAMIVLRNNFVKMLGDFQKNNTTFKTLAEGIVSIAGAMDYVHTAIVALSNIFRSFLNIGKSLIDIAKTVGSSFKNLFNILTDNVDNEGQEIIDWGDAFGFMFEVGIPHVLNVFAAGFKVAYAEVKATITEMVITITAKWQEAMQASELGTKAMLMSAWAGARTMGNDILKWLLEKATGYVNSFLYLWSFLPWSDGYTGITVPELPDPFEGQTESMARYSAELEKATAGMVDYSKVAEDAVAQSQEELKTVKEAQKALVDWQLIKMSDARSTRLMKKETGEFKETLEDVNTVITGNKSGGGGGGSKKAVSDLAKELKKANKVLADSNKAIEDYLTNLDDQIAMIQLTEKEQRAYRIQAELMAKSSDALAKAAQAEAESQFKLAEAYRQTAQQWEDLIPKALELDRQLQNLEASGGSFAKVFSEGIDKMMDNVTSTFTDGFKGLFDGSIKSAKDFMKTLSSTILGSLADLAAEIATKRIVIPMLASVTGGAAASVTGGAAAGGATGSSSLFSGFTSLFSGNGLGASIGSSIATGFGTVFEAGMPQWLSNGVANIAGTSTLALAGGGIAGGILGNILFGDEGYGSVGSSIGSAAGAVIGSMILPGIGTVLGGLFGGAGGGFLGSLFGGGDDGVGRVAFGRTQSGEIYTADTDNLDASQVKEMHDAVAAVNEATSVMAQLLGPEAAATLNSIGVIVPAKILAENAGEALENVMNDTMRRMVYSMTDDLAAAKQELFRRSAGDLDAFAQSFQALNEMLQVGRFALKALQPGINGLEAATNIIAKFGVDEAPAIISGLGNLATAMESLKTDEDKLGEATEKVSAVMKAAGKQIPTTTQEFQWLVKSIDLSTASGAKLGATIGDLLPEISLIIASYEEQAKAAAESAAAIEAAAKAADEANKAAALAADEARREELDAKRNAIEAAWIQSQQDHMNAMISMTDSLAASRKTIEEFGLDNSQLYDRRRSEAQDLAEALRTMLDPGEIEATTSRINTLLNEGWGLLDEGQKAAMQSSYLDYIDNIYDLGKERLLVSSRHATSEYSSNFGGRAGDDASALIAVGDSFEESAYGMRQAAAEMSEAAAAYSASATEMANASASLFRGFAAPTYKKSEVG